MLIRYVILILVAFNFSSNGRAEDDKADFRGNLEVETVSKYVWRAIPQGSKIAFQPNITAGYKSFTLNYFGNFSTEGVGQTNRFNEADYTLGWEGSAGEFTFSPSIVYYTFPLQGNLPFGEAGGRISYALGELKLYTSHYIQMFNAVGNGGYYGDFGLGHDRELSPKWKLQSALALGFSSASFNALNYGASANISALSALLLDVAAPYRVSTAFYLRPHLMYSRVLSAQLKNALSNGKSGTNFIFGLVLGYDL